MPLNDYQGPAHLAETLRRSLDRGRLAHAYLCTGDRLENLEQLALAVAQVVNCQTPPRRGAAGLALDACGRCPACRKVASGNHGDVLWVRPESKSRQISIDQIVPRRGSTERPLSDMVFQKSGEGGFKVGILVAADRLNAAAANAFLKTLEEPPARCLFLLLTTEPERLPETIRSRCLRLQATEGGAVQLDPDTAAWLGRFAAVAAADNKSLLGRYRLLGALADRLEALREAIEKDLTARSPIGKYEDAEPDLLKRWEEELKAAIEAEYRGQRARLLLAVEWWLRDVWLLTLQADPALLAFPELAESARAVAGRISGEDAMQNLAVIERTQALLHTNAQETLVLEVGMLKLAL